MSTIRILLYLFLSSFLLHPAEGQEYSRIISLAPSLTKNLVFLDAEDKLVGCTSYCTLTPGTEKEVVASAITVNLEKIVSLQPDLILVMPLTNPETIASLKKFGIRLEMFPSPRSFDEICEQFVYLGKLIGKQELAEDIVMESKAEVHKLARTGSTGNRQRMFFQIGANPIFSVLPNTFMEDYITYTGCTNIVRGMKGGIISRESVLARNPEIIFVATMGVLGEEERTIWKSYKDLKAAEDDRIYIIDSDLACLPTPLTFVQTLEIMINYLYPEK
jgi:iron complex transport system substrate-binding protein